MGGTGHGYRTFGPIPAQLSRADSASRLAAFSALAAAFCTAARAFVAMRWAACFFS
jgi:hypothetical protein